MENRSLEIHQLLKEASEEKSPERGMDLLSKAIYLADLENDIGLQFETRAQYLLSCFRYGYHDRSIATFPWLLSHAEKHPEIINQASILILYITIINGITEFPNISLEQIKQVLNEMKEWYLKTGFSLQECYKISRHAMLEMGRVEDADHYLELAKKAAPGIFIHEPGAFDAFSEVTYADHLGNYQEAIDIAAPLLKGFPLTYDIHAPFSALSTSFLATGKMDYAIHCFNFSQRKHHGLEYNHLWYGYKFLFFLVIAKNMDAAVNNFRKFFKRAAAGHAKGLSFLYYLSASFFLKEYSKTNETITYLPMLGSFAHYQQSQEYSCIVLLDWLEKEIQTLAVAFNKRNGNEFFTDLIERHLEMEKLQSKDKIELEF
ncbi:MAG: hypothetical protein CMO01_00470 [Thalassobius sp.]|nr:hypothetical protein [Thalassovita sp.]